MRAVLTDDEGHFEEVTLAHMVVVPVLDTVEQRVIFAVTVELVSAVSVIVFVIHEVEVGDRVPEALVALAV